MAYVDATGQLDGTRFLLEWKTTLSRYPESPLACSVWIPQLICHSCITGISAVARIVFVRRCLVEIQYFRTTIAGEQRSECARIRHQTAAKPTTRVMHGSADFLVGDYCLLGVDS